MRRFILAALLLGSVGLLPGASTLPEAPKGSRYLVLENGTGMLIRPGRVVTLHVVGKTRDGTVFADTRKKNQPVTFRVLPGEIMAGWEDALMFFHGGDKGIFVVSAPLTKGGKPLAGVPADKELVFEIEVLDVREK